jgi:hypothetical protein
MNQLTLPLRLAALLAMLVSCGPSGQDIKVARETHYKGDPAALYAAMKGAIEDDYKVASSDEGAFVYKSVARWYTPDGQLDSTGGKNVASLQPDSVNLAVVVSLVKDGDAFKVNVEPIALRLRGLSSNPEPMTMSDPGTPGWVHGKVESVEVKIYEKLKPFAVPTMAAPGGAAPAAPPPAAPAPTPAPPAGEPVPAAPGSAAPPTP